MRRMDFRQIKGQTRSELESARQEVRQVGWERLSAHSRGGGQMDAQTRTETLT